MALSFVLPPPRVLPSLGTPLSRKTVSGPHKWILFGSSQARLLLALPFLFAKNLLEPIKQISVAGETVPFLFVLIVVFNLGSYPEVCSPGEPLASAC